LLPNLLGFPEHSPKRIHPESVTFALNTYAVTTTFARHSFRGRNVGRAIPVNPEGSIRIKALARDRPVGNATVLAMPVYN
jgi:hypothetical protein